MKYFDATCPYCGVALRVPTEPLTQALNPRPYETYPLIAQNVTVHTYGNDWHLEFPCPHCSIPITIPLQHEDALPTDRFREVQFAPDNPLSREEAKRESEQWQSVQAKLQEEKDGRQRPPSLGCLLWLILGILFLALLPILLIYLGARE